MGLLPSCASIALYNVFTVRAPQPTGDELLTDDKGAVGRIADRPGPRDPTFHSPRMSPLRPADRAAAKRRLRHFAHTAMQDKWSVSSKWTAN